MDFVKVSGCVGIVCVGIIKCVHCTVRMHWNRHLDRFEQYIAKFRRQERSSSKNQLNHQASTLKAHFKKIFKTILSAILLAITSSE